jgi:hypothetical protein
LEDDPMLYPEDAEPKDYADRADNPLILDGTANLDDSDDVPQVKGLVELLNQYFDNKSNQNL